MVARSILIGLWSLVFLEIIIFDMMKFVCSVRVERCFSVWFLLVLNLFLMSMLLVGFVWFGLVIVVSSFWNWLLMVVCSELSVVMVLWFGILVCNVLRVLWVCNGVTFMRFLGG